jgi:RNA polymerase sigma-70 factor (ECF subfamily)
MEAWSSTRSHTLAEARHALSRRQRFENLLDRHETRLRRVAHGMLGDRDAVDDVLQEAFIKAYRALPAQFDDVRSESAWLYRVVHRACIDELRRRRRRPVLAEIELATSDEHPIDVLSALAGLGPRDRAAVLLVDLIGLDYETAARVLRVPRGTLAWRLNAARGRLREVLDVD